MSETATNTIVSEEKWRAARLDHLKDERAFTRQRDQLSQQRRDLPWLEITKEYTFEGDDGHLSLVDLFQGRQQLLIYHFMLGPGWDEGCPSCSFWADNYNGTTVHLEHRDTTFTCVSRGSLEEINAYKHRMGWDVPWVSSAGSDFNFDMGVSFTPEQVASGEKLYNYGLSAPGGEEMPGLSAFRKTDDGRVFLTYQTFSRGLDMTNSTYHHLDLTSMGRNEQDLPWSMAWLRRHDAYED